MPVYIHLAKLTSEGIKKIREYEKVLDAAKKVVEDNGCQVLHSYSTLGKYDLVVVLECPDNMTAMKVSSLIAAQGNFAPTTLAAVKPRDLAKAART